MTQQFSENVEITSAAPVDANKGQLLISEPNGNAMLIGRAFEHAFVQSHNRDPLALNPLGNLVGIGTTTPTRELQVNGGIRIVNEAEGAVLLELTTERSWELRQLGSGSQYTSRTCQCPWRG